MRLKFNTSLFVLSVFLFGFILPGLNACKMKAYDPYADGYSEEAEQFMQKTVRAYYDGDTFFFLGHASPDIEAYSVKPIQKVIDRQDLSANPDKMEVFRRRNFYNDGRQFYTFEIYVPRDGGREVINLSLTTDRDVCCQIYAFHWTTELGEKFIMK